MPKRKTVEIRFLESVKEMGLAKAKDLLLWAQICLHNDLDLSGAEYVGPPVAKSVKKPKRGKPASKEAAVKYDTESRLEDGVSQ